MNNDETIEVSLERILSRWNRNTLIYWTIHTTAAMFVLAPRFVYAFEALVMGTVTINIAISFYTVERILDKQIQQVALLVAFGCMSLMYSRLAQGDASLPLAPCPKPL